MYTQMLQVHASVWPSETSASHNQYNQQLEESRKVYTLPDGNSFTIFLTCTCLIKLINSVTHRSKKLVSGTSLSVATNHAETAWSPYHRTGPLPYER